MDEKEVHITDSEWDNRVLCSDESCIGTIGPDGCCRECGKAYEGPIPCPSAQVQPQKTRVDEEASGPNPSQDREDDIPSSGEGCNEVLSGDDEWERRTLCVDEACIGVIGPDGRCKECGKPGASER